MYVSMIQGDAASQSPQTQLFPCVHPVPSVVPNEEDVVGSLTTIVRHVWQSDGLQVLRPVHEKVQILLALALGMPTLGPLAPAVRKPGHVEKCAGADWAAPGTALQTENATQVDGIQSFFSVALGSPNWGSGCHRTVTYYSKHALFQILILRNCEVQH